MKPRLLNGESGILEAEFVDACTPRVPRAEWFEKWDSWWIRVTKGEYKGVVDFVRVSECWKGYKDLGYQKDGWFVNVDGIELINCTVYLDDFECVPVAREGFPAPVSWKVVES